MEEFKITNKLCWYGRTMGEQGERSIFECIAPNNISKGEGSICSEKYCGFKDNESD
jgi:hypothetical protein